MRDLEAREGIFKMLQTLKEHGELIGAVADKVKDVSEIIPIVKMLGEVVQDLVKRVYDLEKIK